MIFTSKCCKSKIHYHHDYSVYDYLNPNLFFPCTCIPKYIFSVQCRLLNYSRRIEIFIYVLNVSYIRIGVWLLLRILLPCDETIVYNLKLWMGCEIKFPHKILVYTS